MRSILGSGAAALLLAGASLWSANYHFAPSGDDSRSSAAAGNPATPWATFARLGAVKLVPGDSILLERRGVWHERLLVSASGTAVAPIVVTGYGTGVGMPELHGTEHLVGIAAAGSFAAKASRPAKTAFAGGEFLPVARFPDTGWLRARMDGDSALVVPALSGTDWSGASIHMVTEAWSLESRLVLPGAGGRLVFDRKTVFHVDTARFFLNNHPAAMGARDAWFQDARDSTVRWSGSSPELDVATIPVGIEVGNRSWVRIEGVRVSGFASKGIDGLGAHGTISGCEIDFPGEYGIVSGGRESRIEGNRIRGSTNAGILANGCSGCLVARNRIRRNAQLGWLGPDGMTLSRWGGWAMSFAGDSAVVRGNEIDSSGYIGLIFMGQRDTVDSNVVGHCGMVTNDGGAIYTYCGKKPRPGSQGSVIRRNVLHHGMSSWFHGIYLDDGSHDVEIDSNVAYGNAGGVFLHNSRSVTTRGNILLGNRYQILLQHDTIIGQIEMENLSMEGNVLVSSLDQIPVKSDGYHGTLAPIATWTGNRYCKDDLVSAECRSEDRLLWRRARISDTASSLGPEIYPNKGFDSSSLGWYASPGNFGHLSKVSGAECGDGNCLKVRYQGDTNGWTCYLVPAKTISVKKDAWYQMSFRARGFARGQKLNPWIRRNGGDWKVFVAAAPLVLDTFWQAYDLLMKSPVAEPSVRIDFTSTAWDSTYWIDDISLREVPAAAVASLTGPRLLLRTPSLSTLPAPGGDWVDVDDTPFDGSIPGPYQGVVLFWMRGDTTPVAKPARSGNLRAFRASRDLVVEGLGTEAVVFDVSGRIRGRLVPDAAGRAVLANPPSGVLWVRVPGSTLPVAGAK